jgi:hypothetical protein
VATNDTDLTTITRSVTMNGSAGSIGDANMTGTVVEESDGVEELIDVLAIAQKLEAAGFAVERDRCEGLSFVGVKDRFGNAVAIYEDGIVVVATHRFPWGFLLSAVNAVIDGLVVRGMRKHAREHGERFGCVGYETTADMVEELTESWGAMAAEQRRSVGAHISEAALVERMWLLLGEFDVSQEHSA